MNIKIKSLYICVKDMRRAIRFYEQFLEQPVTHEDCVTSLFDIDGFRYWLFNNQAVQESVTWGDNCLPSFEVDEIQEAYQKIKDLKCDVEFPLTKIGDNMVFEFTDSEGNDIEVYAKAQAA